MVGSDDTLQPQSTAGSDNEKKFGEHRGRVLHKEAVTHDVSLYTVEKPDGFKFRPGQAVDLSIDEKDWRDAKRPFTLTSLPDNPLLEFIIKAYPDRDGVTEHLQRQVEAGDRVIFSDPWGAIEYQGPGVFIAGGAGVTPFIAIFRELERTGKLQGNRLFFSNKTYKDVILHGELLRMLGANVVFTLTTEPHERYAHGRIDRDWLSKHEDRFEQPFYLCGPPQMVSDLRDTLVSLGASENALIYENLTGNGGSED